MAWRSAVGTPSRNFARRATPWGFPVIYLGWAVAFWLPVVRSGEPVWSFPTAFLFGIGGLSPVVAGLTMTALTGGHEGLRDLGHRLTGIDRIGARWWLLLLLYWPAFNLATAGAALLVGVTGDPLEVIAADRLFDPGALLALLGFAFLFPAVEEIGLRGYWLDQLQTRWSALSASLILGAAWAAWHVPLVFMTGYFAGTTFQPELWWWLPSIVANAVIVTWVYNNTRRSVLAATCFHAFGNVTGEAMGFTTDMYPFSVIGTVLIAAALVVAYGPGSLRGRGTPRPLPSVRHEPVD